VAVITFEVEERHIRSVFILNDPHKLRALDAGEGRLDDCPLPPGSAV
jgi:hypothetical protein